MKEKKKRSIVRVVPRRDETREGVSCAMGRDDEGQKQNRKPLPGLVNREIAGGKNGEDLRRRGREICHQMGFGPDPEVRKRSYLSGCTFSVAIARLVAGPSLYLQVPRFPPFDFAGPAVPRGPATPVFRGQDAQATLWQLRRPLKMLDWSTLAPYRASVGADHGDGGTYYIEPRKLLEARLTLRLVGCVSRVSQADAGGHCMMWTVGVHERTGGWPSNWIKLSETRGFSFN